MSKNMSKETIATDGAPEVDMSNLVITPEHKARILALVGYKSQMKIDQEAYKEDVAAVAAVMGLKTGDLNEMVGLIMKEQEKGGVLLEKEKKLDLARQVLDGVLGDTSSTEE